MKVLFLGMQGSGKGTQVELLSKEFKVIKIVAGDLLREEKAKETKLGKEIADYIDNGKLVPDEIIYRLIREKINGNEDYIIDSFPRTMKQVRLSKDIKFDKVIYIKIPDEIVLDRLQGRLTCKNCNSVFHLKYNKPKINGRCDNCNNKLYVRNDETKEAISERLECYKKETLPVVEYYKKKGIVSEINGNRKIEEIYKDIRKLFK